MAAAAATPPIRGATGSVGNEIYHRDEPQHACSIYSTHHLHPSPPTHTFHTFHTLHTLHMFVHVPPWLDQWIGAPHPHTNATFPRG